MKIVENDENYEFGKNKRVSIRLSKPVYEYYQQRAVITGQSMPAIIAIELTLKLEQIEQQNHAFELMDTLKKLGIDSSADLKKLIEGGKV